MRQERGKVYIDIYFVVTGRSSAEIEVIREVKPDKILLSYFYFRNKSLANFVEEIGYKPEIMMDSGAYSAWTQGRNISPVDYMKYIESNKDYIAKYVALDVVGDPELTRAYYEIMRMKGFTPIPVFHYNSDLKYLNYYIECGETYIALGQTVPVTNKNEVVSWVNYLWMCFPQLSFHLLGSSSKVVLDCCQIKSCDSSSWMRMAMNGKPKHIPGKSREAKIKRALWLMRHIMTS